MRKPKSAANSARAGGHRSRAKSRRPPGPDSLRIIGGVHRSRKLRTSGDPRTRPMKDRLREAIFNLIGPAVQGMYAVDLFAGSGALGLEALSRGAAKAAFFEQHLPTTRIIEQNIAALRVEKQARIVAADTFVHFRRHTELAPAGSTRLPWLVFSSPPYDFYVHREEEMLKLLGDLLAAAPPGSIFVVEADQRFDFRRLPRPADWDVRTYRPAVVGIYRTP